VASISARNSALNTGRPGPLLTKRSAVTVNDQHVAELAGGFEMADVAEMQEIERAVRLDHGLAGAPACLAGRRDLGQGRTLSRGLGGRPTGGCGISFATLESIVVLLRHWLGVEKAEPVAGRFCNA